MKQAIVTGSTGLIASGLVECLLNNNISVIALGRKKIEDSRLQHLQSNIRLQYLQMEMSEIASLEQMLQQNNWDSNLETVFYHFAWSGKNRLADGSVQEQFENVTYSSNALILAQKLGCSKFVNAGSQEERFVDVYLKNHWEKQSYHSNMGTYASAKASARDMCLLLGYLNKIDYVHTRISVIIEDDLATNNYIQSVLKKILNDESFDAPLNNQLFDFISKKECAELFYRIGKSGKNKSDYFLGTGNPKTLIEFFNQFSQETKGEKVNGLEEINTSDKILELEDFDISNLIKDIDYTPKALNFKSFIL